MGVALLQMASSCSNAVGVGTEESKVPLSEGKPTCIICLGMAGSGKTTFVQVNEHIVTALHVYTRVFTHALFLHSENHSSFACS